MQVDQVDQCEVIKHMQVDQVDQCEVIKHMQVDQVDQVDQCPHHATGIDGLRYHQSLRAWQAEGRCVCGQRNHPPLCHDGAAVQIVLR